VNLLDENFPEDQRPLLRGWHIPHRQIGREIFDYGAQDPNIIPLLHGLGEVTFFTQDEDFFKSRLCHPRYCLVFLDVKPGETASYVRRFLRHPALNTHAKRMGLVARVNVEGIQYWQRGQARKSSLHWPV
jgi:hypothetical protein